ncbi:hypothetical protein [Streptomyces sp. NPDC059063]|uniref:hypothetical protein n=1 Tax=Streptomyces sp. NPDC059063 TaxID=3346712 RepID=UPI00369BA1C7
MSGWSRFGTGLLVGATVAGAVHLIPPVAAWWWLAGLLAACAVWGLASGVIDLTDLD